MHRAEGDADAGDAGPDADGLAALRGSGKTLVRIDSVAGMISAPPMPMNARVAMSTSADVRERRRRPSRRRRSTSPSCSAPLRPNRSPRLPAVSSRPANTSV